MMSRLACVVSVLFSASATAYNQERALTFAKLAGAAYCHKEALESWTCGYKCIENVSSVKVCQGSATNAFAGRWDDGCVASFQGSGPDNLFSFVRDLQSAKKAEWDVCDACHVGQGFLSEWNSLKDCIKASLREIGCPEGSHLRATGHSLGAAVNSLAMLELAKDGWHVMESYDFGKPRVGDASFAQSFNKQFAGTTWRVTRKHDPVPNLPPASVGPIDLGFNHTEPEIYYKGSVADGYQTCTEANDAQCVEQYWNLAGDLIHIPDHLQYMDISTGRRGCNNGILV